MPYRHGRPPGPEPLELTRRERLAIMALVANPEKPRAVVATAFGLTPAQLTRALRLTAGIKLFDRIARQFTPEELLPDYEVTGPGSVPPALVRQRRMEEHERSAARALIEEWVPPPELGRHVLVRKSTLGASEPVDDTLRKLGYGPREPEDETDA